MCRCLLLDWGKMSLGLAPRKSQTVHSFFQPQREEYQLLKGETVQGRHPWQPVDMVDFTVLMRFLEDDK
jgi:hypothetical protein